MYHLYNAFLKYCGTVDSLDDCPSVCESTQDELPAKPWPEGRWPYFLDNGWELVEASHI